jgi:hypothetical protein
VRWCDCVFGQFGCGHGSSFLKCGRARPGFKEGIDIGGRPLLSHHRTCGSIRRFGGLSYGRQSISESRASRSRHWAARRQAPDCSPASTGRERSPPFARRDLCPLPVSAVPRTEPVPVSTASRSQTAACAWSTPQGFAAPKASDIGRNSRSNREGNGPTPRPSSPRLRPSSVASIPELYL